MKCSRLGLVVAWLVEQDAALIVTVRTEGWRASNLSFKTYHIIVIMVTELYVYILHITLRFEHILK